MNIRERFLIEIGSMYAKHFEEEELQKIMSIVTIAIDKYELTERTTEVGFVDNSNEKILQFYAGTLLTEGKSQNTVTGYIYFLKGFFRDVNKNFVDINAYDIKLYLAQKQQTVSLTSCKNYRAYLRSFFAWLKRDEFIKENPMDKIMPIKCPQKLKGSFDEVSVDKLRMNCKDVRNRAIVETLLASGIRVSELCNLNISDINFFDNSLILRKCKGNKQRIAYINNICANYLKEYLETRKDELDYLFLTRYNKRMTPQSVRKMLRKLAGVSDVNHVYPHKFRHTFATAMNKKGMKLNDIQLLLGHSNVATTIKYISTAQDRVKAEYNKYI